MICTSYVLSILISTIPYHKEWKDEKHQYTIHVEENPINNYYQIKDDKYTMTYWLDCKENNDVD